MGPYLLYPKKANSEPSRPVCVSFGSLPPLSQGLFGVYMSSFKRPQLETGRPFMERLLSSTRPPQSIPRAAGVYTTRNAQWTLPLKQHCALMHRYGSGWRAYRRYIAGAFETFYILYCIATLCFTVANQMWHMWP